MCWSAQPRSGEEERGRFLACSSCCHLRSSPIGQRRRGAGPMQFLPFSVAKLHHSGVCGYLNIP